MAGSIRQKGPGRWEIRVYAGSGRQVSRIFKGTKRQAERAAAALATDVDRGKVTVSSPGTFWSLVDRYLENLRSRGRAETTVANYRVVAETHLKPMLGKKAASKITALDLDTLYTQLARTHAPATVRRVHLVASGALAQGVRWGLLDHNPAEKASPPVLKRAEPEAPSPEIVARLLEAADDDMRVVILTLAATGMRRGELCGLQWQDLDLGDTPRVVIRRVIVSVGGKAVEKPDTKSYRSRAVSLDEGTAEALKAHRDRCERRLVRCGAMLAPNLYVFSPGLGDRPWRPGGIGLKFRRLADRQGLTGISLHKLRHFNVTRLIAAGIDPRTVATRVGHSRPSVTLDIYASWVPSKDQEAADAIGSILKTPSTGSELEVLGLSEEFQ